MITINDALTHQQLLTHQDRFVSIYRAAFRVPPYGKQEDEVMDFAQSLPRHMAREAFQLVAAIEDRTQEIVGFAYGYSNRPGQPFHDEVTRLVSPEIRMIWLLNSFQFAEIAVTPRMQGRGIGGRLHDHLLRGLSYQKVVLATMAAETRAFQMYCKRGWAVLLDEIFFPEVPRPYRIMGLDLTKVE
jgi:GNAT superfamily N-acetyltransferase